MFSLSKFSGHSPRCLTSYINQEIKSCIRLQIIITQPNTFARTLCIRMQLKVILTTSAKSAMGHIPAAIKHVEHRRTPNFPLKAHCHAATNHRRALKLAHRLDLALGMV